MRRFGRIPARLQGALLAVALVATGCSGKKGNAEIPASEAYDPGPPSTMDAPPPSEAQRSREMNAKQAEMNRKLEEAKTGDLTPEQIEQAYRDYERERLELNQMADTTAPPPADAPAADDYPPPPL